MAMNEAEKERHALRRRRRLRQLLGAVVCLLVVVGAASVISSGVRLTAKLFDDTAERTAYENQLSTLVALDPVPFENLDEANQNTLLNAAIWASIDTEHNTYERDETDAMYLPTLDIDKTAAALYGPDFHFEYTTFEDHGMTFEYVAEKQAYLLPVTSINNTYIPKVTKIKNERGGVRRVTVGYISPFGAGGEFSVTINPDPVKYQDYLFTKQGSGYYLTAITESETQPASSSSVTAAASVAPQDALLDITDYVPDSAASTAESTPVEEPAPAQEPAAESGSTSNAE